MFIGPCQPGNTAIGDQRLLTNRPEMRLPDDDRQAQPSLRVRFFGRFELLQGDEVVSLGRSVKALAILKYLLSHKERPVSQDHLMGWLWPESDPKRARWSLNSAIYTLRKLLKSELASEVSSDYILFDKGHYRLDPTVRVWTDADQFEACYERGRHLENARRRPEAVTAYEEAIELYRDDYLVEDLYEDWTMIKREWFANAYVDMLGNLAGYYMESERYQESIQTCYRLLAKDCCHEGSYRRLIECYDRLGLQGRALSQHQLYETVLRRNRGTIPQPGTRDLYLKLSGQEQNFEEAM